MNDNILQIFDTERVKRFIEANIDIVGYFFDRLRVFPRLVLAGYMWLVWDMLTWAKTLETMSTQQASLLATVVGFGTPLFAFYANASAMLSKKTNGGSEGGGAKDNKGTPS